MISVNSWLPACFSWAVRGHTSEFGPKAGTQEKREKTKETWTTTQDSRSCCGIEEDRGAAAFVQVLLNWERLPLGGIFLETPPCHSVRSKITPGLVSMMTGALQACNCSVLSLDQLRPTLQDVEHRHLRILSNDLRGWNGCRGGAGTRAEMFVLEEGTERTLYVASGCDSFPSTVPLTLALTHLTWKGVQGLMTLAVAIIANKGAGK